MQVTGEGRPTRLSGDSGGDLGASLVEYALAVALVVVGLIAATTYMSDETADRYDRRYVDDGGVAQFDDYGGAAPTTSAP